MQKNPIDNLTYDWITVLQSKAEGLNAYEKYIRDAEAQNRAECAQFFRKLFEQDAEMVRDIQNHVRQLLSQNRQETQMNAAPGMKAQDQSGTSMTPN